MHVSHLSLHDFRSYPEAEVSLGPGVTAFVGRNGQGKTNLVEAVDYVARLSSHRVAGDGPLVRFGADHAVVRAAVVRDGREAVLEVQIDPGKSNKARINPGASGAGSSGTLTLNTLAVNGGDLQFDLIAPGTSETLDACIERHKTAV